MAKNKTALENAVKTIVFRDVTTLKVDFNTNVRLPENYQVAAMEETLIRDRGVRDIIKIRPDGTVLAGNRRVLAIYNILDRDDVDEALKNILRNVRVEIIDVVAGSKEELSIVLDQGTQLGLSRTEILLNVWRLDKQWFKEIEIIQMLYTSLAGYTGNQKKVNEIATITNLRDRTEALRKWLHGTVGNYMLAAAKMGAFVREQMILTHKAEDKMLKQGETVTMKCSRDRIKELSAAKSKDTEANDWTPENGGPAFNALIEKFKAEDAGEVERDKVKRPSVNELKDKADVFKTAAIKNALMVAAGSQEHGRGLMDLDDRLYRLDQVTAILHKRAKDVKNANVKALIMAIIGDGPVGEVEVCLNAFTTEPAKPADLPAADTE